MKSKAPDAGRGCDIAAWAAKLAAASADPEPTPDRPLSAAEEAKRERMRRDRASSRRYGPDAAPPTPAPATAAPAASSAPQVAQAERRDNPLLPVVTVNESPEREAGRLAFGGIIEDRHDLSPAQLPLFAASNGEYRVGLLELADVSGVPTMARGRGAPLDLRLAVGACIMTPYAERAARVRLVATVRELRDFLFPHRWERYRDWPRTREALYRMGHYSVPDAWGGRWIACRLVREPGPDATLEEAVLIDVELPPGSGNGPVIDRRELASLGVRSAPAFRAYLAAHSLCWRPGTTRVPIQRSGDRWAWSLDVNAYPILTARDRRRLAFGANDRGDRTRAVQDAPWAAVKGIEVVDRAAVDRDGRLGWRIVPEAVAAKISTEDANRGAGGR